jgi:lantibiotic biosynthesis protein
MARAVAPDPPTVVYDPADFFVLRAAVLPIEALQTAFGASCSAVGTADPPSLSGATASDSTDAGLQRWVRDPFVQAAIYLVSPSLSQRLSEWLSNPTTVDFSSVRSALFRYFVRMTTRATPFGLMASFTTGRLSSTSQLELGPRDALCRASWFDLGFVYPLVNRLLSSPEVRKELRYTLNTTFFRHDDGWRYVEQIEGSKQRERILTRITASDVLDRIVAFCRGSNGVKPAELSALILHNESDVDAQEASAFVEQLIDSQILIPTLTPTLTGRDPVEHLLRESDRIALLADFHRAFKAAADRLAAIDRMPVETLRDSYRSLAALLEGQFEAAGERHLFHVDLRREAPKLSLDRALVPAIMAAVEVLRRISAPPWPHAALEDFRAQFEERYGDREVELLAVLDEDAGIGFEIDPASRRNEGLLKEFKFPRQTDADDSKPDGGRVRRLIRLLECAHVEMRMAIRLSEEDIEQLTAADARPLPDVFTVFGCVGPGSPAADESGRPCFVLRSISSGVGLFGRFCRADSHLKEQLKALLRSEEALRPAAVFAEIVHLPQDRTGNVVCRPAFRSKDLPYLGESGLDVTDRIYASDLAVSVRGGRIVLRSRSLGREVLPRITCAQNTQAQNASVYRFLAALALQDGASSLQFSWGAFFDEASFLPRVSYGPVVLAPASWRVDPAAALAWTKCPQRERHQGIQAWRSKWRIPRWIQIGHHDNLLSLDLEDSTCVDTLLDEVNRAKPCRVRELIPAPGDLCVKSPEGHHVHEVMLPFVRRSRAATVEKTESERQRPPSERRFAPGSRWLYAKLYGGHLATERALVSDLFDWIRDGQAMGSFDRWHFVRYRDTDEHLRLRFHGDPESLRRDVRPKLEGLFRRWSDTGAIWRFQYDTYEREVDRYGGSEAIEIAESIFHIDSEAIVELLRNAPPQPSRDWRWQLSMKLIDQYYEAFAQDLQAKRGAAELAELSFRAEFRVDKEFEGALSRRYRADRGVLEALFENGPRLPEQFGWAQSVLSCFRSRLEPLASWFGTQSAQQKLTAPLADILRSLVHMHVNRMTLANSREHEMIVYAFLHRLYRSQLARAVDGPLAEKERFELSNGTPSRVRRNLREPRS